MTDDPTELAWELARYLPVDSHWTTSLAEALTRGKRHALKTWLVNHDVVETMQASPRDGGRWSGWTPGPREVAVHSTYAELDGSRVDFREMICIAALPGLWVGWRAGMRQLCIYSTL